MRGYQETGFKAASPSLCVSSLQMHFSTPLLVFWLIYKHHIYAYPIASHIQEHKALWHQSPFLHMALFVQRPLILTCLSSYATRGNVICAAVTAKRVSNSQVMQPALFCPSHFRYKDFPQQIRVHKRKSNFIIAEIAVEVICVTANTGTVTTIIYAFSKSVMQGAVLLVGVA